MSRTGMKRRTPRTSCSRLAHARVVCAIVTCDINGICQNVTDLIFTDFINEVDVHCWNDVSFEV